MPHFIIDCSQSILTHHDEDTINEQIHHTANTSDLFAEHEIKVRVNPGQDHELYLDLKV